MESEELPEAPSDLEVSEALDLAACVYVPAGAFELYGRSGDHGFHFAAAMRALFQVRARHGLNLSVWRLHFSQAYSYSGTERSPR